MEQVLTLVVKLQATAEQGDKFELTAVAFAAACNYANEQVKPAITNKNRIQALVYEDLRSRFGLLANMAVRACARIGINRKAAKRKIKSLSS